MARNISVNGRSAASMISRYRRKHSLPPVNVDHHLTKAAEERACNMAANRTVSHSGAEQAIRASGYGTGAENLGAGPPSFDVIFEEWKKSPSHNRAMLLPDATHIGIAAAGDKKWPYWVLLLAGPIVLQQQPTEYRRPIAQKSYSWRGLFLYLFK